MLLSALLGSIYTESAASLSLSSNVSLLSFVFCSVEGSATLFLGAMLEFLEEMREMSRSKDGCTPCSVLSTLIGSSPISDR